VLIGLLDDSVPSGREHVTKSSIECTRATPVMLTGGVFRESAEALVQVALQKLATPYGRLLRGREYPHDPMVLERLWRYIG
jgi:hypothetical protein